MTPLLENGSCLLIEESLTVSAFSHIQFNVTDLHASTDFYVKTLAPLGFKAADSQENEYVRITNGTNMVIVLCPVGERYSHFKYHRRAVGLGHFAISVESKGAVDDMEAHLESLGVKLLGEGKTELAYRRGYYCLLFEDPDRIMIEIVCHDPHYYSPDPP